MSKTIQKAVSSALRPRLRVMWRDEIALGPGKAELLALVEETGSISQEAHRMGMAYMRAWSLVKTMNQCFKEPLVVPERGGRGGGGAKLTAAGRRSLELYHQIFGRFPIWQRLAVSVGFGYQVAVTSQPTYNNNFLLTVRFPF